MKGEFELIQVDKKDESNEITVAFSNGRVFHEYIMNSDSKQCIADTLRRLAARIELDETIK